MKKSSFAQKFQLVLLILLFCTFIMITQTASKDVFQVGIVSLIVLEILQVAVGNINLEYNFRRWIIALAKILLIVFVVIGVSMVMVQWFLDYSFVSAFLWVLIIATVALFALFIFLGSGKKLFSAKNKQ